MKASFIFLLLFFSSVSFGQQADHATVQQFWNSNILEIVRLDKEKIIEHTSFPVAGSWGYVLELEGEPESWTSEDFINNIPKIFNDEVRIKLRGMTYNDLVHHKDENGELNFILQLNFQTVVEAGTFESSTLLYFKKFDGIWKLFQIEYAG